LDPHLITGTFTLRNCSFPLLSQPGPRALGEQLQVSEIISSQAKLRHSNSEAVNLTQLGELKVAGQSTHETR
jgi:hypothetical protein